MIYLLFNILLISLGYNAHQTTNDYTLKFSRVDNLIEVIVNDSLVYSSGIIDNNPALDGGVAVFLNKYLTPKEDKVIIRLYNGHPPYTEQDDMHWELECQLFKGDEEIEYIWEMADDNQIGLVFEEIFYL